MCICICTCMCMCMRMRMYTCIFLCDLNFPFNHHAPEASRHHSLSIERRQLWPLSRLRTSRHGKHCVRVPRALTPRAHPVAMSVFAAPLDSIVTFSCHTATVIQFEAKFWSIFLAGVVWLALKHPKKRLVAFAMASAGTRLGCTVTACCLRDGACRRDRMAASRPLRICAGAGSRARASLAVDSITRAHDPPAPWTVVAPRAVGAHRPVITARFSRV